LRNYTICIFSHSSSSDYLGGSGITTCYKKIDGIWKEFGDACGWDS